MSDLIEEPVSNAPEFTVTELSGAVKRVIEGEFGRVRVRGEVGRVARPRSGHLYLDLKDDRAVLSGVIWKGVAGRLSTPPEEGMEVIATGRLTTFAGQSRYQMIIEEIAPAGAGALMAMLEKRKAALAAEGLFAAERKRALPHLPEIIGVVTSPSGAVIRDILHRLRDRFPRHVIIWPVAVQGERCAREVAAAIRGFGALAPGGPVPRPDLLIVARGGGSIEDLWGFNEEIVVRAAAESPIPLISAVGHETDTTLIDLAADYRAPTPTAAAERAVPVRRELLAASDALGARLGAAAGRGLTQRGQRLRDLARALPRPETLVGQAAQRLDFLGERLPAALRAATHGQRLRLQRASGGLRPGVLARMLARTRGDIDARAQRLMPALIRGMTMRGDRLRQTARGLRRASLERALAQRSRDRAAIGQRLLRAAAARTQAARTNLEGLDRLRQTLGYRATLRRGYAVIRAQDAVVTSAATARTAKQLDIEFHDGHVETAPARKPRVQKDAPGDQGTLL